MKKLKYMILMLIFILFIGSTCFAHDYTIEDLADNLSHCGIRLEDIKNVLGDSYQSFIDYYLNCSRFYVFRISSNDYIFSFDNSSSGIHVNRFCNGSSWSRPNDILFQISSNTYHINFSESTYKFVAYGTTQQIKWFSATDYEGINLKDIQFMRDLADNMIVAGYNMNFVYYVYPNGDTILLTGDKNFGSSPAEPPKPYFVSVPNGLQNPTSDVMASIYIPDGANIKNYYFAITQYLSSSGPLATHLIRDFELLIIDDKEERFVNFSNYFTFDFTDYYYKLQLIKYDEGVIDESDYFWFYPSITFPVPSGDDSITSDEQLVGGVSGILQNIIDLPKKIIDGIAGIFIPSDGFFSDYFNELNSWFSDRLGILYFPFDFIVSFFSRIYTSDFGAPTIEIPAMKIPLFEEYGNIYDGTTFNFMEFVNQNETFKYIYNLYLIAVDGIVIFGLVRLLMRKYEEVTSGGN